jgi:hypothetical protein
MHSLVIRSTMLTLLLICVNAAPGSASASKTSRLQTTVHVFHAFDTTGGLNPRLQVARRVVGYWCGGATQWTDRQSRG